MSRPRRDSQDELLPPETTSFGAVTNTWARICKPVRRDEIVEKELAHTFYDEDGLRVPFFDLFTDLRARSIPLIAPYYPVIRESYVTAMATWHAQLVSNSRHKEITRWMQNLAAENVRQRLADARNQRGY